VGSLGDVEEDTVHKEEEDLKFQVLAPGEAQVEEEFREPFELNEVWLLLTPIFRGLVSVIRAYSILSGVLLVYAPTLSFDIDLPVFLSGFLSRLKVEVENERFLNPHV
jgi:hypothetical protein